MFENLTERLESAFKQIKGEGRITELNIAAAVKDIRRALVDADVNYKIAKEFTDTVKDKAMGQKSAYSGKSRPVNCQDSKGRARRTNGAEPRVNLLPKATPRSHINRGPAG